MTQFRLTVATILLLVVGSVGYSFATQDAVADDSPANPFRGKLLIFTTPDGYYGIQENVEVTTVGSTTFLVLQPIKRPATEHAPAYETQQWISIEKLSRIQVFADRAAADAYEKATNPAAYNARKQIEDAKP